MVDRSTEFGGEGKRYNDIRETIGFNFFTVDSTTHRIPAGICTLRQEAGLRETADFMLRSSLTRRRWDKCTLWKIEVAVTFRGCLSTIGEIPCKSDSFQSPCATLP